MPLTNAQERDPYSILLNKENIPKFPIMKLHKIKFQFSVIFSLKENYCGVISSSNSWKLPQVVESITNKASKSPDFLLNLSWLAVAALDAAKLIPKLATENIYETYVYSECSFSSYQTGNETLITETGYYIERVIRKLKKCQSNE